MSVRSEDDESVRESLPDTVSVINPSTNLLTPFAVLKTNPDGPIVCTVPAPGTDPCTEQWAWEELGAFLRLAQTKPINLLLSTYWTMGAVRHGDYVAKVRVAPVQSFADRIEQRALDPIPPNKFSGRSW
ncbi:MAG TPA: hypothetical protein VLB68_17225 [Pyrinomonadaceae bacterium]|nr:hypothetical protein [Pyrinomonadaceae bacterium]